MAISTADLAADSDLIVVADMGHVTIDERGNDQFYEAPLVVREVIHGRVAVGETLYLTWANRKEIVCPRIEHERHEGKRSIYLLRFGRSRTEVDAPYPWRVIDLFPENLRGTRDVMRKDPHANTPAARELLDYIERALKQAA